LLVKVSGRTEVVRVASLLPNVVTCMRAHASHAAVQRTGCALLRQIAAKDGSFSLTLLSLC
jgi:hypothetical protein